ncbi:MAG TPA: UDP-N-acetylglucosamine 1-carboxyvinyltransferase [Campylobacterales bacterium]|nr:UDP-N-acetylglucosamine 1-carboxyvinyltransferase [Campylobacterales bacterium]
MDYLEIEGDNKLSGAIKIDGAKNAALPLLAATILFKNEVTIDNLPRVNDVFTILQLLENLGATTNFEDNQAKIDASSITNTTAIYDIVRKMRASILTLGPLLARFGECKVSLPGGCAIGQRPIDLHLKALEMMGAEIVIEQGYVRASVPKGLQGATIVLDKITVTGTENIVMAAALAHGETKIINAAKEPEVVQLCEVLNANGVKIEGIGSDELIIKGTGQKLIEAKKNITVIPDRIEAGTYLCAGAITNSKITLNNVNHTHLFTIILKLQEMGFDFDLKENSITIKPAAKIKGAKITTSEYPGFPTDMQAQFMALALVAEGASSIDEKLFENRFMHVSELIRMGANIILSNHTAMVEGKNELNGADVMATDLRASSALVLAALVANGTTRVHRIYHLDRGYVTLEKKLQQLGAKIKRLKE